MASSEQTSISQDWFRGALLLFTIYDAMLLQIPIDVMVSFKTSSDIMMTKFDIVIIWKSWTKATTSYRTWGWAYYFYSFFDKFLEAISMLTRENLLFFVSCRFWIVMKQINFLIHNGSFYWAQARQSAFFISCLYAEKIHEAGIFNFFDSSSDFPFSISHTSQKSNEAVMQN